MINSQEKVKSEFPESFINHLFWLQEDLKKKSAKRCKHKQQLLSVPVKNVKG